MCRGSWHGGDRQNLRGESRLAPIPLFLPCPSHLFRPWESEPDGRADGVFRGGATVGAPAQAPRAPRPRARAVTAKTQRCHSHPSKPPPFPPSPLGGLRCGGEAAAWPAAGLARVTAFSDRPGCSCLDSHAPRPATLVTTLQLRPPSPCCRLVALSSGTRSTTYSSQPRRRRVSQRPYSIA